MKTEKMSAVLYKYIRVVVCAASVVCFIISHIVQNIDLMLISVVILFVANFLYGLEKFYERFVFTVFNTACMFFLFGRNVIELISGENWARRFSYEINSKICTIIFISLLSMFFGALLAGGVPCKQKNKEKRIKDAFITSEDYNKNLQIVSLVMFLASISFTFVVELEKLLSTRGQEYAAYYLNYQTSLPSFFLSISALSKFCLCLFLITNPPKKTAFPILGLYVVSNLPSFAAGQRNHFLSAALLAVCYYVIRDYCGKKSDKKWLGKFEISAVVICIPFLLAFLSMYESIRLGKSVGEVNIGKSILKLFSSQGVTYDVMGQGIMLKDELPQTNFNYTFGPIIEYFRGNSVSSFLFGTTSYPKASAELATYGNSLADSLAYMVLGEKYLNGAGLGSSFMLENYIDFGYIGVVLFSMALGFLLIAMMKYYGRNKIISFFSLVALLQMFMLPRAPATGWVVLLLYIPMYFLVLVVITVTGLTLKKYYQKSKGAQKCFRK